MNILFSFLKKQSKNATLMPKRGKPFFLPLAKRQKRKSGARFPDTPFSVLGFKLGRGFHGFSRI
jgi:hypothetical protein